MLTREVLKHTKRMAAVFLDSQTGLRETKELGTWVDWLVRQATVSGQVN